VKARPLLIDTGFVVALVNRADPAHHACVEVWKKVRGPFVSVEGVLVETAWMLRKARGALQSAVELLASVGTVWAPPSVDRTRRVLHLMHRYSNVPMDFVDGQLIVLADEVRASQVLTLDRRGFRVFRSPDGRALELLP
jgi:predicted nucleic acid-binding protein